MDLLSNLRKIELQIVKEQDLFNFKALCLGLINPWL